MIPQWLLMHRNSFVNFAAFGYSRWIAFCAATFLALAGCNTREAALQVAKQYGEVTAFQGKFRIVLLNRQAVDKVLPLLASVPDLEELSIWGVALTDAELRTIGKLDQISGLRLEKCEVDDNDLRFLKPLSNLKQLDLPRNPVTDDGLKELSGMVHLYRLDLGNTNVVGPGLENIPSQLKDVCLSNTGLDDTTVVYCAHFPRLERLEFQNTNVTEVGLMKLVNLHWLNTLGTPAEISREALRKFRAANLESRRAARAAGEDVPPDKWGLAPYE